MANTYDKIFKENIAALFPSLSKRYLGLEVAKTEALKDKLQSTLEREADFLQKVTTVSGEELIVQLEFQSTDDPKMLERMRFYHTLVKQKYDLPLRQYVIYLGQKATKMRSQLEPSEVFRGFDLIDLQSLDYQSFLKSPIPEEVVLAVLGNFKAEDASQVLAHIIGRLQELISAPATLAKYSYHVLTLARLRNLSQITQKTLNKMAITYDIKQDALYLKGIEQGIEQGILQTVHRMKKAGFSTEDIMKATGLSQEQIEKITE